MRIINFGQMVNLEHGTQIAHQITIELPSGQRHQVLTDEATVQQLVDIISGNGRTPAVPQNKTLEEILDEELIGESFGGDYDPGELATDMQEDERHDPEVVMGALTEMSPVSELPRGGIGQSRPAVDNEGFYLPVRAKTVPKDEMGYPIVPHKAVSISSVSDDDGEGDGTQI